jgi:O-antigen ligase
MDRLKENSLLIAGSVIFLLSVGGLIWMDLPVLVLFPLALMAVYATIYHQEFIFLALVFLTPLSVNLEEYVDGIGLFLPTEPLLFGLMLLLLMQQTQKQLIPHYVFRNPIVWTVFAYLLWVLITSITSTHPDVSLKFLLAKLWFAVPLLLFAPRIYEKRENINLFFWLLTIGMIGVMCYTLIVHASYGFGEKEGHWVMSPFFKDHTIYGALVAMITPLIFGIYFSKKHNPLTQMLVLGLIGITLLGLYFSYTRAAWLSIIAALMVFTMIKLRIRFSIVAGIGVAAIGLLIFFWDNIQMEMARNKHEHTTEAFTERIQSATNVTTDASNLERLNRWSCAIEMFKERPLFGFGPGTYAFEYARFQDPENLTIISTNFGNMGNAHSEYLGPLAETGLPGMLFIFAIVAAIFYRAIRLYNTWPTADKEMRTFIMAMIMSLVTYFVHGILNNYLDTDKAAVPIWTMCAIFMALEFQLKSKSTGNPQTGVQADNI